MSVTRAQYKSTVEAMDSVSKGELTEHDIQTPLLKMLQKLEEKMDNLKSDVTQQLDDTLQSLKLGIQDTRNEIADLKVTMKQEVGEVKDSNIELEQRVSRLEDENSEMRDTLNKVYDEFMKSDHANKKLASQNSLLKQRLINLEAYGRRENLLFFGIKEMKNEDCSDKIKDIMINTMKLDPLIVHSMRFQRCHRLRNKCIICRFMWFHDRQLTWAARFKLKNSGITVSEDFPQEIVTQRRILFPIMKEAQKKPNTKAFLLGNKLIINDSTFTVETLKNLPTELDPARLATKQVGNVTAFFTASSPLSNFFPLADFVVDGTQYDNVEQYYQWSKAIFAEMPDTANKIKASHSPAECKRLGHSVKTNEQDWLAQAKAVMKKACLIKFTENPRAKQFLLDTGNTVLAEAGPNLTWGTGLGLHHPDIGNADKWKGQNLLGQTLVEIRDELRLT